MAEQHIGKDAEGFDCAGPWCEQLLVAETGRGRSGAAAASEPRRHERREPSFVLHRQNEAHRDADQQSQRGDENVPARGAHGCRQIVNEECAQPFERADARSIDREIGAQRQVFEIEQQIAVERDGARHRQRGQRRAIKHRQPLQFVERQRAHAAPLDAAHQLFQLAPAVLAAFAKLAAFEHKLGLAGAAPVTPAGNHGLVEHLGGLAHIRPRCLIIR